MPANRARAALKVLPAAVASDPERLARFQREAEVVAALSHPNIVTIYSVEEADGLRFLTMELDRAPRQVTRFTNGFMYRLGCRSPVATRVANRSSSRQHPHS